MQLNWLGFAVGASQSPRACLALYRLLLSWDVSESSAAVLEPGIHHLYERVDDEDALCSEVETSLAVCEDDEVAGRPLRNLHAGLDCLWQATVSVLQNVTMHDPASVLDFAGPRTPRVAGVS